MISLQMSPLIHNRVDRMSRRMSSNEPCSDISRMFVLSMDRRPRSFVSVEDAKESIQISSMPVSMHIQIDSFERCTDHKTQGPLHRRNSSFWLWEKPLRFHQLKIPGWTGISNVHTQVEAEFHSCSAQEIRWVVPQTP